MWSIFLFFCNIHYKAFMVDQFPVKGAKLEELKTSSLMHSRIRKAGVSSLCKTHNVKAKGAGIANILSYH